MVSPASSIVSVRDSSGHLYAVTPTIGVTDSGYTDPIGFVQAFGVQDGATASDSIALAVAGQGINSGFHYLLRLAGIRSGNSASGVITLQALGIGDEGAIGTWTATKQ